MIGSEQYQLLKLSLSASMVAECVNDLAGDIQCQLKGKYEHSVTHSVATDVSTHVIDVVKLAVFITGANDNFRTVAELLKLAASRGKLALMELFLNW